MRPPVSTRSTVDPWTWISRTRTSRSPGTSRSVSPRASGPPRSVPVTTVPRPLTAKTRSIARVAGRGPTGPSSTRRGRRARPVPPPVPYRSRRTRQRPTNRPAPSTPAGRRRPPRPPRRAPVDRIDLGDDRQAAVDPERIEQSEVLDASGRAARHRPRRPAAPHRSRPPRRACCRRAGRGPGTSTKSMTVPSSSVEVRVSDIDRHPPSALLRQPVCVDARQRAQQRRLAVVDVPGGPDDERHVRAASADPIIAASVWSAVGSTVRRSSTTRPSSIRPMTGGAPAERGQQRRGRAAADLQPRRWQRLARQRPATDRRERGR